MRRVQTLLAVSLAMALVACGGGDPNGLDQAADDAASTVTTIASRSTEPGPPTTTSPPPDPSAATVDDGLKALPGEVRFANFYVDTEGDGTAVDVYWGTEARPDRKAATIPYGHVGARLNARGSGVPGADGSPPELVVSFYASGRHAGTDRITTASTGYGDGFQYLIELSWGRTYGEGPDDALRPAAIQVIREHEIGSPRDGTAVLMVNNLGSMAIGDGSPLVIGPTADCRGWVPIPGGFESGNAGESTFEVTPGAVSITAFDSNCHAASAPLHVDVRTGDRLIVFIFGTGVDNRRLLAVPALRRR